MSTVIAPAPLLSLSAPLPAPRRFTLLDAAQSVTPDSDRWLAGAFIEDFPPGPVDTHDPCSDGTGRAKAMAGIIARPMAGVFTAYLAGQCSAQFIGPDPAHLTERLRLAFEAIEATAVERVLASSDGHGALGAALTDDNVEVLDSGAAQPPREGLAVLEQRIAENGTGILHCTPAVAVHWAGHGLISAKGGVMYTAIGTPIAIGAGYIGAIPSGQGAPGDDQEWAFATGPVAITRSDYIENPQDYAQALDRSNNDVVYFAERHYLINWVGRQDPTDPDHIQAAVLIDRTP